MGGYDTLDANECKQIIVSAIQYDEDNNPNPLELPEDCVIILKGKQTDATFGKYDYMMNDMMYADVDINRN